MAEEQVLNTHNAEILLSAANKSHYPQDDLPEVALAGRSNVGKSSFINTLLGRKNLARTSGKPGKTQLLNFYNIDDKLRFVDVPGYGYARVSKKERAKWGKMIEEYLVTRDNLRVVVSLVDLRHEPTQDDIQMYEFLKYYEIPVIVVATKTRFLAENGISTNLSLRKNSILIKMTISSSFHLSHVTVMMKHGILFWQNCKKSSEKSEFFSCDSL